MATTTQITLLVTSCCVAFPLSGCLPVDVARGVYRNSEAIRKAEENRARSKPASHAIPADRKLVEIKCYGLQQKARCRFKATAKPVSVCAVLSLTCYDGAEGVTHETEICSDWLPDSQYVVKTFVDFTPPLGPRERCPETYIGDHKYSFEKPEPPKKSNRSGDVGGRASSEPPTSQDQSKGALESTYSRSKKY